MIVWRLVGLFAVIVLLAAPFTPLPNALARAMAVAPREGPADAIVVLGGTQYPDGLLTDASLRRAVHGVVLWRRGLAPAIVFTGGRGPAGVSEARVRARLAASLGVPASAMLLVEEARTTREEAVAAAAAPSMEFSFADTKPGGRLLLLRTVLGEGAARLYYRVAGFG